MSVPSNEEAIANEDGDDPEPGPSNRDINLIGPVAPVALMTETQSDIPAAGGHVSPRHDSNSIEHRGFISIPAEDMDLFSSPPPRENPGPARMSSPELGVGLTGVFPADNLEDDTLAGEAVHESVPGPDHGARPVERSLGDGPNNHQSDARPIYDDWLFSSSDEATPPPEVARTCELEAEPEVDEDRKVMPPSALPLSPHQPVAQATGREPRFKCKWSIQTSPGHYRVWGLNGSSAPRSMAELYESDEFKNINLVRFVLQGLGMSWDDVVAKQDEESFNDMKARFEDKIYDNLREINGARSSALYDIIIVPI
ncbi:hypothetical protein NW766_003658 [Fusarium irregulare]|uniref:Uncharacterized protein n=1 Tax=Fusarium irregulare TaxID=2494466 RepID=A0A9W8PT53_9HYPO|nr:hypothetical protein NW766_003658 [Fusarium irregulare]